MQFYNFFNMGNFALPRFDFGSWTVPNFGWNNYSFFNSTNVFSSWNNNFGWYYNFNWNNYSQPIGDTFESTKLTTNTTPASFIFNNVQTPSYIPKTKIDYTPSTYLAPTPTPSIQTATSASVSSKSTPVSTSTTIKTTYSSTP